MTTYQVIQLIVTLVALGITIGVFKSRNEKNADDIKELKCKCELVPVMQNEIDNLKNEVIDVKSNHNEMSNKLDNISALLNQLIGEIKAIGSKK